MALLDFPDPSASPYLGPNGVIYTYVGIAPNGYWSGSSANDGTAAFDDRFVNISGDTMTGLLSLSADPTAALHAATKQYVDLLADGATIHVGDTEPVDKEQGSLWWNTTDNTLYIYYDEGVGGTAQWVIAIPQGGGSDSQIIVSDTPPSTAELREGALWWNSDESDLQLYVLYNNGTEQAPDLKWIEASPMPGAGDDGYVNVTGDDMTGNLTLGTDKITLDATDGSATFADTDKGVVIEPSVPRIYTANTTSTANSTIYPDGILIETGNTNPNNTQTAFQVRDGQNATIRARIAQDGSAEFAGIIETEGTRGGFISGQVPVISADSTWGVWSGKNYAGATTSQIRGDGTAYASTFHGGAWTNTNDVASTVHITGFYTTTAGVGPSAARFPYGTSGANGRNLEVYGGLQINTEPDNPANYTTTTDSEGNTTEVYNGPTLDVKDRLQNLISRLDAIEANEVVDDATDSALLQLVANLSARLDERDAQIAALTARVTTLES